MEYRLTPSACQLPIELRKLRNHMKHCCEPRRHSCQLAFFQPFALSSTCGKFLTDFLNFKFLLLQLSLYIQQNSLSDIRKKSLHCIIRAQLTQGWVTAGQPFWNLQFWCFCNCAVTWSFGPLLPLCELHFVEGSLIIFRYCCTYVRSYRWTSIFSISFSLQFIVMTTVQYC